MIHCFFSLYPFAKRESEVLVTQLCQTLCNATDCSQPDSSVCGIFQARILEWVAISSSSKSSWPKDRTEISCNAGRLFITEPPGIPSCQNGRKIQIFCGYDGLLRGSEMRYIVEEKKQKRDGEKLRPYTKEWLILIIVPGFLVFCFYGRVQ